jgi:chemotaxis response regulator CheB
MDHFKVLVIDDSLMIRAMIEQIVSRDPEFHVVGVASDVPEAREVIETKHPNLITLDLMMPGIGGLDFLDELAGHPHAPVVVVSSSTKDGPRPMRPSRMAQRLVLTRRRLWPMPRASRSCSRKWRVAGCVTCD